uniref:Uncharacterized protein n=1 Tax=Mustela putorius furo TaxID=9669 RepID=M3YAN2_MUSPF
MGQGPTVEAAGAKQGNGGARGSFCSSPARTPSGQAPLGHRRQRPSHLSASRQCGTAHPGERRGAGRVTKNQQCHILAAGDTEDEERCPLGLQGPTSDPNHTMSTGLQPRGPEPTRVNVQTPEAATAVTPRCTVPDSTTKWRRWSPGARASRPAVPLPTTTRACEGKRAGRFERLLLKPAAGQVCGVGDGSSEARAQPAAQNTHSRPANTTLFRSPARHSVKVAGPAGRRHGPSSHRRETTHPAPHLLPRLLGAACSAGTPPAPPEAAQIITSVAASPQGWCAGNHTQSQ